MRIFKTLTCAVFTSGLIAIVGGAAQAETFQTGEASWYGPAFHGRQTSQW
jgi:rare lipoprotein A (peptidoglycan hydrolase)